MSGAYSEISPMELGRHYTGLFHRGVVDTIWQNMSVEMQDALGSGENLSEFYNQARAQLGDEVRIIEESVEKVGGGQVYLRTSRFEKITQLIVVQFAFGDDGLITGFYIRPVQEAAPSEFLDYETKTLLRLPFDGEWYVFWGGRTVTENYHAVTEDQRFAYDILMMRDGTSYKGDGKKNEQYYCFGERVLAPGAGVVVALENGVEDNTPGEMNPRQPMGNYVTIDHGNGEYSFLAHFQKGSVTVTKNQRVELREFLGLCGNSGNSSEPHLHYHLQTTSWFQQGKGLPAQFQDYMADGEPVKRGEPVKGQTVR